MILQDTNFWKLFLHCAPPHLKIQMIVLFVLDGFQNHNISSLFHFVQVYLKLGCHLPLTSVEWTTHSTTKVETLSDRFVEMIQEFTKLSNIKREWNAQKSKGRPLILIDLVGDKSFNFRHQLIICNCVLILMKCNIYNFKYFNVFWCLPKNLSIFQNKTHGFLFCLVRERFQICISEIIQ